MRRHVVLAAPPWYPVPPHGYGGIEMVVHLLAVELRARGHRVTLLAAEESEHDALVLAPQDMRKALGGEEERLRELAYATRIAYALNRIDSADVVHDHCGFGTLLATALTSAAPVVHTVHGPIPPAQAAFYGSLRGRVSLVAISDNQRAQASRLPWLSTVYNAVDVAGLGISRPDSDDPYLLCLARICADKGQHLAVEVARRAGLRLVLAGKVEATPAGRAYYEKQVRPHIDGERVVHLENVHGEEKSCLLSRATALLAPIQWDEPFGLSVVEAMVGGTPAISMARGAAPELVEEGVTGRLVADVDEMVEAVGRVAEIDHARCAARARERFGPAAMADGYLRAYAVACGEPLGAWEGEPGRPAVDHAQGAAGGLDADVG